MTMTRTKQRPALTTMAAEIGLPTFWMSSCGTCLGDLQLCRSDRGDYRKCVNCGRISPDGTAAATSLRPRWGTRMEKSMTVSTMNQTCPAAPDCLECPLPSCRYDDPKGFAEAMKDRTTQTAKAQA